MYLLFLILSFGAFALTPPSTGIYVFTTPFELTGCAEFEGGRGVVVHCKKQETKKFAVGEEINVSEFFWDDKTKTFGAKYVHLGTNRSVPVNLLKLKAK